MARIGRAYILWSVNKLARAVTKWTRAGDKRLARLPTQMITDKIAMWETRFRIVDVLYSKDSDFAGDIEDSKSTSGGILFIFGSRAPVHGRSMINRRKACAGEIEASEFDIEKIEREFNLSCWTRVCHTTR